MSLLQVEAACCCKLNLRQLFSTISRVLPDLYIVIIAFAWTKVFIIIPISILTLKDTIKPVKTTNINFNKSKIFVAWKLSMTLSTYRLSVCMTSLIILFVTRPTIHTIHGNFILLNKYEMIAKMSILKKWNIKLQYSAFTLAWYFRLPFHFFHVQMTWNVHLKEYKYMTGGFSSGAVGWQSSPSTC